MIYSKQKSLPGSSGSSFAGCRRHDDDDEENDERGGARKKNVVGKEEKNQPTFETDALLAR